MMSILLEEVTMAQLNNKEIVLKWSLSDFEQRANDLGFDLTEEQLLEAMQNVENYYDCN